MLTLSSSNLLAQKPYTKTRKDIKQGPLLALEDRISLFRQQMVNNKSDIFLFQEVDEHWENVLNEISASQGYSLLIKPCRNLKMAIAYKSDRFQESTDIKHHSDAGILSITFFDKFQNKHIQVVNIHADWGKANLFKDSYKDIFQNQVEPIILGGDFNLDSLNPASKNGNKAFFADLIAKNEYLDLTSRLLFTAKYVKDATQGCKIDLVLTKNTTPVKLASVYPDSLSRLLPHTTDDFFNPADPLNHFSDHAVVSCSIKF